jgi:hypothetical protein
VAVRTPFVVMGVLIVVLLGISVATSSPGSAPAERPVAPVAVIARRVETLRHLRYRTIPQARVASPAEARRDGLADFDRSYPPARRHADETMLAMLGLVPPGTSLRDVAASLYAEGVAGYYDPRTKQLRTVTGPATGTRVLAETVLAHELDHALEDQHFGLLGAADRLDADSDAALAHLALVEGTATTLMQQYMRRYFTTEEALVGSLAGAFSDTGSMPAFLETQTLFPYTGGMQFAQALLDRGGGSWALVDTAERFRPPASTEQVLHPDRYIQADQPLPVRVGAGRALRAGWTRAAAGTWGELQTREMLAAAGGGGADAAAAGWGGDRWELWRSGVGASVLVMRWRWDTARDETEFTGELRRWVREARRPASDRAVVAVRDGAVTLALAPGLPLAQRVAAAR